MLAGRGHPPQARRARRSRARRSRFLVGGIADGSLSDAQVGALAMALFLRGMEPAERVALTEAMRDSGTVIEWDLDRPVLDKHSTGGVGDKVSLMLAPIVAACGGAVPMISGRGLGHTGGTLDKLDSIPGYDTVPDVDTLRRVVARGRLRDRRPDRRPRARRPPAVRDPRRDRHRRVDPADRRLDPVQEARRGARRAGHGRQVRLGRVHGQAREDAEELARALVEVAGGAGLPTVALLTDMDQVLGDDRRQRARGRARRSTYLTGARREPRLHEVTMALAASLLAQGGLAASEEDGRAAAERALESGAAAERFARMVAALGGPADLVERPRRAPRRRAGPAAPCAGRRRRDRDGLPRRRAGHHRARAATAAREDDVIDPAVGLAEIAPVGAEVGPDRPLAVVHARDAAPRSGPSARCGRPSVGGEALPRRAPSVAGSASRVTSPRPSCTSTSRARRRRRSSAASPSATASRCPTALLRTRTRSAGRTSCDFLATYDLAASVDPHRRGLPRRHLRVPRVAARARARSTSS